MKRQLVKHMIHSTAALAMCAALITGIPFTGSRVPGKTGNNGKSGIITELPNRNGKSGKEPEITLQSNRPNDVNIIY
ncbi:MAG TPA: hypothetical protein DCZ91_01615 [Lachnospiraceae bacterium]|nr:hypothetical protein [Lachnospiraceae bacterium]